MRISKIWLIASLLAVFMAGCGGGNTPYSGGGPALSTRHHPPTVGRLTRRHGHRIATTARSSPTSVRQWTLRPAPQPTFTLARGVRPVTGTVSCVGRAATFAPKVLSQPASPHTATLTTGIKDRQGKHWLPMRRGGFTTDNGGRHRPTGDFHDPPIQHMCRQQQHHGNFSEAIDPATATTTTFTLTQLQSTGQMCF